MGSFRSLWLHLNRGFWDFLFRCETGSSWNLYMYVVQYARAGTIWFCSDLICITILFYCDSTSLQLNCISYCNFNHYWIQLRSYLPFFCHFWSYLPFLVVCKTQSVPILWILIERVQACRAQVVWDCRPCSSLRSSWLFFWKWIWRCVVTISSATKNKEKNIVSREKSSSIKKAQYIKGSVLFVFYFPHPFSMPQTSDVW